MTTFIIRRLAQSVITVFAVVTLTFFLIRLAPGDPVAHMVDSAPVSAEFKDRARENLGLNLPLHRQYVRFVGNVARGDLGLSLSLRRPVTELFASALPNTLLLGGAALLIAFILGVLAGTVQGMRPHSTADHLLSGTTITLYSTPVFWLGLMLLLLFGQGLGWMPAGGMSDPVTHAHLSTLGKMWDVARHLVLPALTLGLVSAAVVARYQRSSLAEALKESHVRTARAKGLKNSKVILSHGLRNSLLTTVTLLGLFFPVLLSGSVLIETVFAWPGMGKLSAEAVFRRDYPVVTGAALISGVVVVMGNLLADLLYRWLDPRLAAES